MREDAWTHNEDQIEKKYNKGRGNRRYIDKKQSED